MEWFAWKEWHPTAWAILLAIQGLYLFAVEPLRKEFSWADRFDRCKAIFFTLGLLVIGLVEGTPLHGLSENYLFTAHMSQHLLLLLAAPPLLLLGTPEWLLRPVTTLAWVQPVVRVLTKPIVAGVLFNVVLLVWHVPVFYNSVLEVHGLHYLQHALFLFVALLLWWPVLSPLPEHPRLSYAGQLFYLFAVAFPQKLLAAILTLAGKPLYDHYMEAPRIGGISAHMDQQIGGAIMWGPFAFILFAVFGAVFFVWFAKAEREEAVRDRAQHQER
ncbi:MAG: cytochrome c oxidase assembly protein [Dehalococcoidia bacterium]|nr:cytochrome c oxidase assembly protein [Dehalococcoidia bacterium]